MNQNKFKMKNPSILLLLLSILTVACNNKEADMQSDYDTMMAETIEVHDAVMKDMMPLGNMSSKMKKMTDSLPENVEYKNALSRLENAHDFMMNWMQDFGQKFPYEERQGKVEPSQDLKTRFDLLKEENQEVKAMQDSVTTSIENAKQLLGS